MHLLQVWVLYPIVLLIFSTSYIGGYAGFKHNGTAVAIGQSIPKLIDNNSKYKTFAGKFSAGVVDFTNESGKGFAVAEVSTLVLIGGLASGNLVQSPVSFTNGLTTAIGTGLVINNTVGQVTDAAIDKVKEFIKKMEEKWTK